MKALTFFLLLSTLLVGCGVAYHKGQVQDDSGERLTLGTVQKEIRVGMSGADVALVLGSPNIVSTDEERREVWIYDKVATDKVVSAGGVFVLSGATSSSQRTLTVVIKFDNDGKVRDFAYHTSKF